MNTSILLSLRDEIALEGLEGITFEALWIRLQERDRFCREETKRGLFFAKFDDKFKNLLFRIVVKEAKNGNVQFYRLPTPRPPLAIFNRSEHFNEDTGTLMYDPELVPEDVYSPIVCISESKIRGSCRDYRTRVCITEEIVQFNALRDFVKSDACALSNVVVVASQNLRASAILGPLQGHTYEELKLESYCILEYIARKRFYGYLNSKKEGMTFDDTRIKGSFYYYRNELLRQLLVVQFPVYFYDFKRKLCHNSYVLYVPRFRPTNVNPIDWKVLEIGNLFVSQQVAKLSFTEIKAKLTEIRKPDSTGDSNKKVDSKKFRDFLQRYGRVFSMQRDERKKEFMVEFLCPLNRPITVDDLYPNYKEKLKDVDDDEEDDFPMNQTIDQFMDQTMDESLNQGSSQEIEQEGQLVTKTNDLRLLTPAVIRSKCPQLKRYFFERVYSVIERYGTTGCTRVQLLRVVDVPNSLIRSALKLLQNLDLIVSSAVQAGRQKVYVYRSKKFTESKDGVLAQSSAVSERSRIRMEMILDFVSQSKFVDNVFSLRRYILWKESDINFKIDMKTVMRLLKKLAAANFIQIRCFRLAHEQYSRNSILIFYNQNPGVQTTDELLPESPTCTAFIRENNRLYVNNIVEHLLLRSKFHYFAHQQVDLGKDIQVTSIDPIQSNTSLDQSFDVISMNGSVGEEDFDVASSSTTTVTTSDAKLLVTFHPSVARKTYGGKPSKVERTFILYRYLFYLLVDDDQEGSDYLVPTDWRYYVPKLCRIFSDLQCSLLDVLLYMPISLFRDIYQISHVIPGLETILADRTGQHQMLYQVDPLIRRHLLYNRKSVNIIFELLEWATHFGLLELSERNKLQFSETIQFQLKTVVRFPKPMILLSVSDNSQGGCEYNFGTLADFDHFVEDVEWHLVNRVDCQSNECPFDERLRIHTLPVFGFKGKRKNVKEEELDNEVTILNPDCPSPPKKKRRVNARKSVLEKRTKKKKVKPEKESKPKKTLKPKKPKTQTSGLSQRTLRQYWTREEDHFILKCRLASILLDPKSNFQTCISRTVICELLHNYIGPSSLSKDADACARRLLKFSKKSHIQRIIAFSLHELDYIDAPSLRPSNKNDIEAMVESFKVILDRILAHRFTNTDFFMSKAELHRKGDRSAGNSVEFSEDRPNMASILSQFDIVDVHVSKKQFIFKDPSNYYDIHIYVRINLLLSTLTSLKFTLNASGNDLASEQASRRFYLRTMFKSLKHFPERRIQETILNLVDLDMIKRNRKNLKQQRTSGYGYRISPTYFQKLVKFNIMFGRRAATVDQRAPFVIEDNNSLFGSIQFIENLSSDVIGVLDVESTDSRFENVIQRPIEFNIEIPQHFMSVPKEYVRNSERGRHVSRSLMLSQNSIPTIKSEILETEQEISQIDTTRFTDSMLINHIKVHINREPHSEKATNTHAEVIEKLELHLRTFNPAEFESSAEISSKLTRICLNEYPPIKFGLSAITKQTGQALIEAIRDVKMEGMGLKWEQLLLITKKQGRAVEQELRQFLKFCEVHKLIFAVGIVNTMWVHRDQLRFWMVHSYQNLESWVPDTDASMEPSKSSELVSSHKQVDIKQICFLPKLWKLPDGRMDLNTLMACFNLILGHLTFTNTVMDRKALIDTFGSVIAPVQLFELLDILLTLECVRKSQIPLLTTAFDLERTNVNSFDDFFAITQEDTATSFEPPQSPSDCSMNTQPQQVETVYEASVDAFSRLSLLYDKLLIAYGSGYRNFEQQNI